MRITQPPAARPTQVKLATGSIIIPAIASRSSVCTGASSMCTIAWSGLAVGARRVDSCTTCDRTPSGAARLGRRSGTVPKQYMCVLLLSKSCEAPGTNALTCVASPKRCITSSLHAYASTHGPAINAAAEAAGVLHMLASTRVDTLRRKVYRPRLCSARLRTASCRFSFAISINCRADFVSIRLYLNVGELHLFRLHQWAQPRLKLHPTRAAGRGYLLSTNVMNLLSSPISLPLDVHMSGDFVQLVKPYVFTFSKRASAG